MTDSLPQVHQQEDAGLDTNTSGHDKRAQIAEGGKRLKVIYMSTNEKPVKRRRPNYSRDEVFALVTGVRKRWHILSSVSSTLTAADKQQAWEAVTKEVNGVSRVVRSVDEMRVKFFDFKSATKRKMMALNLKLTSTGDGSVTSPKFSEAEEAMAQLLDCEVAVPMGAKLKPQRPLPHPVSSGGGSAKLPKPKDFEVSRLQDSVVLEGLGYHLESEYYLRHQECLLDLHRHLTSPLRALMNPEPDVSATSTTSLYNERGHRPRHMQLPMCSSDTEELDEYLYAVDEAYSPHKSEEVESSDENETPEDTVVLHIDSSTVASPLNSQTRPKTGQKRISRLYWEHIHYDRNEAPTIPIFDARNYSGNGEGGISLPIDLFRRFFTDDLIDMIVDQSNLYSVQENPNRPLNLDKLELEQWLGLCFHMSLSKISDIRLHWSVGYEKFSSVMRRDRWEEIKSRFHLVDYSQTDQQDKLSKVRPLLEHLRSKFKEIPMTEYLCVGEQVVPFKGNPSMEQYIPEKPHKRGCKFFVLADCMGMVYDFIPYTGKTEPVNNPNVPDLQGNSNSVLHLAECIPPFKNHKLYFDDQFTSLPLLDRLASRGIWCTGAIKENRIPNLTFMSDKLQALGQGFHDEWETKSESNNKITVLKWFDNKPVHLASTFATSFPLDKCTRSEREMKERVEVPRPFIVKDYNTHRFGVDLHDQLMSYYAMSFSSKEYYQDLIFHMIDMTVINSWLLHRREADHLKVPKRKQMSLCLFKLKLADSLLLGGKSTVKKRKVFSDVEAAFAAKKRAGKATKPIPDKNRRLDMTGHFPTTSNKRGLCKLPGCTGRVLMFCTKCEVNLCCESKRNCFLEFHTK